MRLLLILEAHLICILGSVVIMSVATAASWNPLPDTGQKLCYTDHYPYEPIPCPAKGQPFYGQDAQYFGKSPIYQSQIVNGNAIVVEKNTGLVWQARTAETDGNGLLTTADALGWEDAIDYCQNLNFGGRSNWRLPTVIELESIVDYGRYDPSINPIFRAQSGSYWASTNYIYDTYWRVSFGQGGTRETPLEKQEGWVRCVSGPTLTKFGPYTNNGNKTLLDNGTGLTWMLHPGDINNDGAIIFSQDTVKWSEALSWCESATIGGNPNWRLPNIRELRSLVDYSSKYPAIDPIFIEDDHGRSWSSTTIEGYPENAWIIDFSDGDDDIFGSLLRKTDKAYVRCVKGGLLPPPQVPEVPDSVSIVPILLLLLTEKQNE